MATLTGTRAAASFPAGGYGEGADLKVAWGSYTLAANPEADDVIEFCWLPKNARVIGGFVQAADIDTHADTPTLDIDIGWATNGVEEANATGFGNLDVWHGAAVANFRPETGNYYPLSGVLVSTGPQKFSAETKIIGTVVAAAADGGTGIISCVVFYVLDH